MSNHESDTDDRDDARPGNDGEHTVQAASGTEKRAREFYDESVHDELTDRMAEFVSERLMFFLATANEQGNTDCSVRVGPPGFVTVLDPSRIAYPEYRGNGVHASLGNLHENPHATLLFMDWWNTTVGLHLNGQVHLRESLSETHDPTGGGRTKTWVELDIEEACIHCAKHIPRLSIEEFDPPWRTDDNDPKRAGFFSEG